MADEGLQEHMRTTLHREVQGDVAVLSSRAKTGFSGIITVSAVLMFMQLITGVQAFPL